MSAELDLDMDLGSRDLRQREIIPPSALAKCRVTVVGVGAIGRQVALQLATMGVPAIQVIDPDRVEAVNLAAQGYHEADLGELKVVATRAACLALNSQCDIEMCPHRFRRSGPIGDVLFACVDSIETRRLIWQAVRDRVSLFVDGRMAAESLRVLAAWDDVSREQYPRTHFSAGEAHRGSCTAKSTIYCANVAAGLMICQFARWLRGLPLDADMSLNLLAGEMAVMPLAAA